LEQNQNTDEPLQPQSSAVEVKVDSDSTPSETSTLLPELKEETLTPLPQPGSQSSNVEPQTPAMEVHKHPHHVMHKKKWTEYLLEFFMIFFAVFLGFLAENSREHILESTREKEYIKSFYEDLTADENDLQLNINFLRNQMQEADSLQKLMWNMDIKKPANHIYMYLRGITRSSAGLVYPNDRTIVQLRNAGGMRLIRNKSVSDSMVGYYRTAEIIQFLNQDALVNKTSLREKSTALMNAQDFAKIVDSTSRIINPSVNIYLRKADPDVVNSCLVEVDRIKTLNSTLIHRITGLKDKAGRIKNFLSGEYNLQDD